MPADVRPVGNIDLPGFIPVATLDRHVPGGGRDTLPCSMDTFYGLSAEVNDMRDRCLFLAVLV